MGDNDNGESTEEPTGFGSGKARQGNVLRLVASRSDKHAENLQTLMTEVMHQSAHLIMSSKKGISAHQLHRTLEIS